MGSLNALELQMIRALKNIYIYVMSACYLQTCRFGKHGSIFAGDDNVAVSDPEILKDAHKIVQRAQFYVHTAF